MKRISFLILGCFCFLFHANAQTSAEKSKFSFGILLEGSQGYVKKVDGDLSGSLTESVEIENRPGFSLGIKCGMPLTEMITLSPQAILSFQEARFLYRFTNDDTPVLLPMESVNIEIPVHFVFSKPTDKKFAPTVIAGGRYLFDIVDSDPTKRMQVNKHDFAIDLGIGVEAKFDYFNVRPELMYSLGLSNLKVDNTLRYNTALESINRDRISLRLLFYK